MKMKIKLPFFLFFFPLSTFLSSQKIALKQFVQDLNVKYAISIAIDPSLYDDKIEVSNKETNFYSALSKAGLDYYLVSKDLLLIRKNIKADEVNLKEKNITITGVVFDKITKAPLPYAAVYLEDKSYGTLTDSSGTYRIELPSSKQFAPLIASYVGYNSVILSDKRDFELSPNLDFEVKEVTIISTQIPSHDFYKIQQSIDQNKYLIFNFTNGDWVKNIQYTVSGINSADESTIALRSMKQDKTNMVVDNIDVIQTSHFFNNISSYNELYFDEAVLKKNQHGTLSTSGIAGHVEINSNPKNYTFKTTSNLLYSGINLNLQSEKIAFQLGGRKSYGDYSSSNFSNTRSFDDNKPGGGRQINNVTPNANFYDLNARLNFKLSDRIKIKLSGLKSMDENEMKTNVTNAFNTPNTSILINDKSNTDQEIRNIGTSATLDWKLSEEWKLKLQSNFFKTNDDFTLLNNLRESVNNKVNLKTTTFAQLQSIINKSAIITAQSSNGLDLGIGYYDRSVDFISQESYFSILDKNQDASTISLAFNYNKKVKNFYFNPSVKFNRYSNISAANIEPGLSLRYTIYDKSNFKNSVRATIARKFQNQNIFDYESSYAQNFNYYYLSAEDFPILRSDQFSIGFDQLFNHFKFDAEGYYFNNEGAVLFTNNLSSQLFDPFNSSSTPKNYDYYFGTNKIIGADFSLAYEYKKWQSILNYTISKNTQQFPKIYNGLEVASPNDRRHVFSFTNEYRINTNLSAWSNFTTMSGTPYFDIGNLTSKNKPKREVNRREVINFVPSYLSIDAGINYSKKLKGLKINLGVSATNITDNTNVKYIQQTSAINDLKGIPIVNRNQVNLLGRFFNVHFGFEL
jgi:hypothetical protein